MGKIRKQVMSIIKRKIDEAQKQYDEKTKNLREVAKAKHDEVDRNLVVQEERTAIELVEKIIGKFI